jgi:hypothetical protein
LGQAQEGAVSVMDDGSMTQLRSTSDSTTVCTEEVYSKLLHKRTTTNDLID